MSWSFVRTRRNPTDDSGYRYFKYYMMVKYLIDVKQLSVEDLFTREESEVLSSL